MKSMFWQTKKFLTSANIHYYAKKIITDINRVWKVVIRWTTSSPLVSSQRPNTEFAAANTEHLEFNVVVIPAYKI